MFITSRLHRTLPALIAAAGLGLSADVCQAGKMFRWLRRSLDCRSADSRGECGYGQAAAEDDGGCCWKPRPAPAGAVVSAIPAVMVAQPAVAVSTQALQAQLAAPQTCQSANAAQAGGQDATSETLRLLLEKLESASSAGAPAAGAPGAAAGLPQSQAVDPSSLKALEFQLDELNRMIDDLNRAFEQSDLFNGQ